MGEHWRQGASDIHQGRITRLPPSYGTTGSKMALARSAERYTDYVALT